MDSEEVIKTILRHRARLESVVRARVPASEVDDVFQHALIAASLNAHQLRDPEAVLPWFRAALRNAATDQLRSRMRAERVVNEVTELAEWTTATPAYEAWGCSCSLDMMADLPTQYREILCRLDVHEEPLKEAAASLGLSPNNATVRLHRARRALREKIEACCGCKSTKECLNCRCATGDASSTAT